MNLLNKNSCIWLLFLIISGVFAAENYGDWDYFQEIELNTTSGGANVSGDVLDFPVLIRLNPGNFSYFSQTLAGGADIRFAKTDGTHLSYEIERWVDNASDVDTAEIWVKLDTVHGNNSTQKIHMYWGKSGAADSSDAEEVFATGTNFKAVYHLNENPGGGAGSVKDRTSNNWDGSPSGMNSDDCVAGAVGIGLDFDGSDYIDLGNVNIHNSTDYSVSMWVNGAGTQSDKRVFAEGSSSDNDPLFTLGTDDGGSTSKAEPMGRDNSGDYEFTQNGCPSTDDVFDGTWHHVVWVDTFNGTNNTFTWFVDGSAGGTNTYTKGTKTFTNSAIGAVLRASASNYFTGKIDEVRLVNTNRSTDWIKLCYENQKSSQSLVSFGDVFNGTSYSWDASSSAGVQSGDGTWGSDNFWTNDGGSSRVAWPGSGNDAVFTGNSGSHSITVSSTQALDSLTIKTGTYTFSGGTLNFGSNSGINIDNSITATIGSALSSSAGIKKFGGGTLVLSGTNTYTSATTVSAGALHVTGSTASGSAVTVASGATLGGTGTVSGTVAANGTIAPGTTGYGTLTIGSSLTFSGTGSLSSTIGGTTAGTNYDQIVMSTGTLTLASASLSLTLSYEPTASDAYTLIDNAGTNAISGTFSGYSQGATVTLMYNNKSYDFTISYTGGTDNNDVVLTYSEETPGFENYGTWDYSLEIELNTTSEDADVSDDVLNFPVLIRLNPGNFSYFSQTLAGGADIRFAKTDGTHLSYEIERWVDNASDVDTAEIWVKVDTVYGNNSTQSFLMYWGKSGAVDSSNGAAVFETSNGFVGVWHLGEDPTGGAGAIKDATSNSLDATSVGSMTSDDLVAGMIGKAHDFDGTDDGDSIPYSSVLDIADEITLSGWVNVTTFQDYSKIVVRGMPSHTNPYVIYSLGTNSTATQFLSEISTGESGSKEDITGGTAPVTGTWYYMAFTYNKDSTDMIMYRDAAVDASNNSVNISMETSETTPLMIGKDNYDEQKFKGIIDEVTVSDVARSADWIELCYENQKSSQTLVSFVPPTAPVAGSGNTLTFNGTDEYITLPDECMVSGTWTLEFWIRPNSPANDARVFTQGGTGCSSRQISAYWHNDHIEVVTQTDGSNTDGQKATGTISDDNSTWTHVAWTYDGSTHTVYVNGRDSSGTPSSTGTVLNGSNYIGRGGSYWKGAIDEVRLWNDVRTQTEIQDNMYFPITGSETSLVGYWRMDASSGSHLEDYSTGGSEYDGTLYNMSSDNWIASECWKHRTITDSDQLVHSGGWDFNEYDNITLSQITAPGKGNLEFDNTNIKVTYKPESGEIGTFTYEYQISDGTSTDTYEMSVTVTGSEDYFLWNKSKRIYINTTSSGADLSTTVYNFPMLIRLTASDITFSDAKTDGSDIRFSKSDDTPLYFERERWDLGGELAEFWVLMDTVLADNSSQYIKIHWDNDNASDMSQSEKVFNPGNGFISVWHLGEDATDEQSSATHYDATLNGFDGSQNGNNDITGAVGKGQYFDGTDDVIKIDNSSGTGHGLDLTEGPFTISAWYYSADAEGTIVSKRDDSNDQYQLGVTQTKQFIQAGGKTAKSDASDVSTNTWYLGAVTVDSDEYPWLFQNDDSLSWNNDIGSPPYSFEHRDVNVLLGARYNTSPAISFLFEGRIDEVRIESINRDIDWLGLCYNTQKPNADFLTFKDIDKIHLLPLTIRHTIGDGSDDVCTVSTDDWKIIFSEAQGAGIKWLSDESAARRGSNQLSNNLFYVRAHDINSYSVPGQLTLLDSGSLFCHIGQTCSLNAHEWRAEYTVYGSGRVFIRVETDAFSSAYDPTNGVEFRVETNVGSNGAYYAENGTASVSNYILHADSGSGRFDILLAPYEDWDQASGFTSTTGDFYGYVDNDWQLASGHKQSWEFMIDFAHKMWNDTTGNSIGSHVDDFRVSDSIEFIVGTNGMEKDWERMIAAHWPFDDSTGTTVDDIADGTLDHDGTVTNAVWDNSDYVWKGALDFDGSGDYVTVSNNVSSFMHGVFTVMMWLKPETAISASSVLFSKYSSFKGYKITGDASGNLALTLDGVTISANSGPGTGSWKHIAVTNHSHGARHTLYIDGKLVGYQLSDETITSNSANVIIGDGYDGKIDDVRFYNSESLEGTIRAISQNNYRPDQGKYMVRADNSGTIHLKIDGSTSTPRRFPIFQIYNYWSTSLPKAVNYNGSWQTSTDDYIADLDDENNVLTIGFDYSVSTSDLVIYVDDVDSIGANMVDATKKMSWGIHTQGSTDYFWVKNFSGSTFGSSSANEYFLNWKMATSNAKDGEIWFFASSVTEAGNSVDTSSITNLIEGSDGSSSFGSLKYIFDGNSVQSANSVTSSFTYTVVESSDVRVVLRINKRSPGSGGDLFEVTTQWTLYPTGQIFRWDSISSTGGEDPDDVYFDVCLDNSTSEVLKTAKGNLQGVMYNASSLPDFTTAFLTFKNTSGTITSDTTPWLKDTMSTYNTSVRTGISFQDITTNNNTRWSAVPIELTTYIDLQCNTMDSSYMDSVSNSVQNINFSVETGTKVTNSAGDADGDGFNEREGAYVIQADDNTINFKLEADGASDGCRFNPAIRVTNYSRSYKPRYVRLHNADTSVVRNLVDGYNYNSYLNDSDNELVIQLDTVLCVDTRIHLSADTDLAVTLSEFYARPGDNRDTLFWETESESENLGYYIHRRIQPQFFITLAQSVKSDPTSSSYGNAVELYKTNKIRFTDTSWVVINSTIIPGAEGGTSVGPRKYSTIDYDVKNDVLYQYKLRSVSFDNTSEFHGPIQVMPKKQEIDKNIQIICAAPNPTLLGENNQIYFKYLGVDRVDITVKIFDHLGNLLYKSQITSVDPNTVFNSWDLTNRWGRKVGNGVYIAVFRIDRRSNDSIIAKLMLGIRK